MHTCTTCMESYPGIVTHPSSTRHIFHRYQRKISGHQFSKWNNMDPDSQPNVLSILTQIEEMLIAHVKPIL